MRTVYTAYGVYGFLSPAAAFVLLGLVALVTLYLLSPLPLSFLTPMLVATDVPTTGRALRLSRGRQRLRFRAGEFSLPQWFGLRVG